MKHQRLSIKVFFLVINLIILNTGFAQTYELKGFHGKPVFFEIFNDSVFLGTDKSFYKGRFNLKLNDINIHNISIKKSIVQNRNLLFLLSNNGLYQYDNSKLTFIGFEKDTIVDVILNETTLYIATPHKLYIKDSSGIKCILLKDEIYDLEFNYKLEKWNEKLFLVTNNGIRYLEKNKIKVPIGRYGIPNNIKTTQMKISKSGFYVATLKNDSISILYTKDNKEWSNILDNNKNIAINNGFIRKIEEDEKGNIYFLGETVTKYSPLERTFFNYSDLKQNEIIFDFTIRDTAIYLGYLNGAFVSKKSINLTTNNPFEFYDLNNINIFILANKNTDFKNIVKKQLSFINEKLRWTNLGAEYLSINNIKNKNHRNLVVDVEEESQFSLNRESNIKYIDSLNLFNNINYRIFKGSLTSFKNRRNVSPEIKQKIIILSNVYASISEDDFSDFTMNQNGDVYFFQFNVNNNNNFVKQKKALWSNNQNFAIFNDENSLNKFIIESLRGNSIPDTNETKRFYWELTFSPWAYSTFESDFISNSHFHFGANLLLGLNKHFAVGLGLGFEGLEYQRDNIYYSDVIENVQAYDNVVYSKIVDAYDVYEERNLFKAGLSPFLRCQTRNKQPYKWFLFADLGGVFSFSKVTIDEGFGQFKYTGEFNQFKGELVNEADLGWGFTSDYVEAKISEDNKKHTEYNISALGRLGFGYRVNLNWEFGLSLTTQWSSSNSIEHLSDAVGSYLNFGKNLQKWSVYPEIRLTHRLITKPIVRPKEAKDYFLDKAKNEVELSIVEVPINVLERDDVLKNLNIKNRVSSSFPNFNLSIVHFFTGKNKIFFKNNIGIGLGVGIQSFKSVLKLESSFDSIYVPVNIDKDIYEAHYLEANITSVEDTYHWEFLTGNVQIVWRINLIRNLNIEIGAGINYKHELKPKAENEANIDIRARYIPFLNEDIEEGISELQLVDSVYKNTINPINLEDNYSWFLRGGIVYDLSKSISLKFSVLYDQGITRNVLRNQEDYVFLQNESKEEEYYVLTREKHYYPLLYSNKTFSLDRVNLNLSVSLKF